MTSRVTELPLKEYKSLLERFADHIKKSTEGKNHNDFPTVRDMAKRYHCSQQDIIDLVEDCENVHLVTGLGVSGGVYEFENTGDQLLEWY